MVDDWRDWICQETNKEMKKKLRQHERTGRLLGADAFIDELELVTERKLKRKKTGPKGPWKKVVEKD